MWRVPRIILQLSAGPFTPSNVSFKLADDELTSDVLLLGVPVLYHLGIDSSALLNTHRDIFDRMDCVNVGNLTANNNTGKFQKLMVARIQRVEGAKYDHGDDYNQRCSQPPHDRLHVYYYVVREETEPSPGHSLLNPLYETRNEDIMLPVDRMLQSAKENGLPAKDWQQLQDLVYAHIDIFSVGL